MIILHAMKKFSIDGNVMIAIGIFGAICLFIGINIAYKLLSKKERKLSTKEMTLIALQSAITIILYQFVKFNLPFFPPWLDIQVSEVPAMITGFAYGPYAGFLVVLVRFIVKLPMTITMGVGEFADLVLSSCVVLISSYVYLKQRNLKGVLIGTIVGVVASTILSVFVNWLVLIPAYINIAHFPLPALVGMMDYIPFYTVTETNFMITYILLGVIPFNLFRYILVVIVTFVLYKKTHIILKRLAK
jgi:riboflavin transporter FmnP